jgi:acetyl-CoA carboxylase beta subunit
VVGTLASTRHNESTSCSIPGQPSQSITRLRCMTPWVSSKLAYSDRLTAAQGSTRYPDAVRVVRGKLQSHPAVLAAMDFRFLGGSVGVAAGEAITAAAEAALADRVPLLLITASGGHGCRKVRCR